MVKYVRFVPEYILGDVSLVGWFNERQLNEKEKELLLSVNNTFVNKIELNQLVEYIIPLNSKEVNDLYYKYPAFEVYDIIEVIVPKYYFDKYLVKCIIRHSYKNLYKAGYKYLLNQLNILNDWKKDDYPLKWGFKKKKEISENKKTLRIVRGYDKIDSHLIKNYGGMFCDFYINDEKIINTEEFFRILLDCSFPDNKLGLFDDNILTIKTEYNNVSQHFNMSNYKIDYIKMSLNDILYNIKERIIIVKKWINNIETNVSVDKEEKAEIII